MPIRSRPLGASVTRCRRRTICVPALRRGLLILGGAGSPLDNRINNETHIVARTPFLQFLKTLSSDVSLCEGRGISLAELNAERRAAPSRRQFVAGDRGDSGERGASDSGLCRPFPKPASPSSARESPG